MWKLARLLLDGHVFIQNYKENLLAITMMRKMIQGLTLNCSFFFFSVVLVMFYFRHFMLENDKWRLEGVIEKKLK
jgi:hypothetical protein